MQRGAVRTTRQLGVRQDHKTMEKQRSVLAKSFDPLLPGSVHVPFRHPLLRKGPSWSALARTMAWSKIKQKKKKGGRRSSHVGCLLPVCGVWGCLRAQTVPCQQRGKGDISLSFNYTGAVHRRYKTHTALLQDSLSWGQLELIVLVALEQDKSDICKICC